MPAYSLGPKRINTCDVRWRCTPAPFPAIGWDIHVQVAVRDQYAKVKVKDYSREVVPACYADGTQSQAHRVQTLDRAIKVIRELERLVSQYVAGQLLPFGSGTAVRTS